ncbi:diphthine synthase [Haladaptatus sp. F3-133]|jgi:diphthine synthase|uniref:Diphthine synthase n=1 Tax=Halorutilus salinus TaxID=2487751 RepID=A0A9Q4GIV0_9EURY|nr:diphthine synthase [Halorutilus salinus]MCX2819218.1 diphthine synthase [Halorutilus salinus]
MLTFVGLGLYDERDVTLKGRDEIADADTAYAEFYTSVLPAAPVEDLEEFHAMRIEVLDRDEVESGTRVVDDAEENDVVFLVGGDPMVSTTHAELRLRALERGIETRVVHAPSAATAVCGATGLQNYRFGASTTLPFDDHDGWEPESPFDRVADNLERDLHTLVYLDISDDGRYMRASDAAERIEASELDVPTVVGVARLGSDSVHTFAGAPEEVADHDFGSPLHLLVVPASLHPVEEESLSALAGM